VIKFIHLQKGVVILSENREYVTQERDMGSINISEEVICVIAAAAIAETEGVAGFVSQTKDILEMFGKKNISRGVRVDIDGGSVTVYASVALKQNYPITDTAEKIQDAVATAVESMTGLSVAAVNIKVCSIVFNK